MKAPDKIIPKDNSDYLRVMTRAVFQSGFNWSVIEKKWPGFEEVFDSFNPEIVANYNSGKISEIKQNPKIVRNSAKIDATIHNAQNIVLKSQEYGEFKKYLEHFGDFEATVKGLRKSFKWLGDFGSYYFLYVVDEPVPSYEDWCKSRGIKPLTDD